MPTIRELTPTIVIFEIIILIVLAIYGIITLRKFIDRKTKIALFLTLNFLSYIPQLIFKIIALNIAHTYNADTYESSVYLGLSLGFAMIANLCILLFYGELVNLNRKWKIFGLIVGIIAALWMLLPFDEQITITTPNGPVLLSTLSNIIIFLYTLVLHIALATTIFRVMNRVPENRVAFTAIAFGSIVELIYNFLGMLSGISNSGYTYIIASIVDFIALTLFYIGFFQPSMKK
jgi:hypothetical protein